MGRDNRLTIRNMPLRTGLVTAGQRGTVAENAVWTSRNMSSGFDGMIAKRPGVRQWGQRIMVPSDLETGEFLSVSIPLLSKDELVIDTSSARSRIHATVSPGQLVVRAQAAVVGDPDPVLTIGRTFAGSEVASTLTDWSFRGTMRFANMPVATPTVDAAFTFRFRVQTTAGTCKEFAVFDEGLYYRDATAGSPYWVLCHADTTILTDGSWHTLELRHDNGATIAVYIDDTLIGSVTAASVGTSAAMSYGQIVEFQWTSDQGMEEYSTYLSDLMFRDTITTPFVGDRIQWVDGFKRSLSGGVERSLIAAGSKYIYADIGLLGVWRPIITIVHGQITATHYRTSMIFFDSDSSGSSAVYQWSGGYSTIVTLTDAPKIRFGTEHRTRLWGSGEVTHPLRVYFTASRQPNVWFAPDVDSDETTDEVLNAGYIEIPSRRGDAVTAIYGEYDGSCIVATDIGIWKISGSSPESFAVQNVTPSQGATSCRAICPVGTDLWMTGRQGVVSLQSAAQTGDIRSQIPSGPIQDLWTSEPNTLPRIDLSLISLVQMAYNYDMGLVYVAIPELGQIDISAIYVYNVTTQSWQGPWELDSTALASVEIADPVTNVVLHGSSDGRVGFTYNGLKLDYSTDAVEWQFYSVMHTGRSLDPSLVPLVKTWRTLRLFIQPRGDYPIDIVWHTDEDSPHSDLARNTNLKNEPTLSNTFRLDSEDDGRLASVHDLTIMEITLDARGRWLYFELSGSDDFVLQGYELEFTSPKYEQED